MNRLMILLLVFGCHVSAPTTTTLRINELVADNEGVSVDEAGETEDYIELVNTGPERIWLDDYTLTDSGGEAAPLPALPLAAGERIVFHADGDTDQGERHLPFKLSSRGEAVELRSSVGLLFERVEMPALGPNESYARFPDGTGEFERCRFASPTRDNQAQCGPPPVPEISVEPYDEYTWLPDSPPEGLRISELSVRGTGDSPGFVELFNGGDSVVTLDEYDLRLAPWGPAAGWPTSLEGAVLPITGTLAPGQYVAVPVSVEASTPLVATEDEGVLSLFRGTEVTDRVDFMQWPEGTSLARAIDGSTRFVFCSNPSESAPNDGCEHVASRSVHGRLRHLRTAGDFAALAAGGTMLGIRAVKFIVDMERGDAVHFAGAEDYDLHYTFVRENILGEEPLDRCDEDEAAVFRTGWGQYSRQQYDQVEGRRFLQGTLVEHVGAGVHSIDFVTGDRISAEQMRRAFFAVTARVQNRMNWTLRPQGGEQAAKLRSIEGTVPIVGEESVRVGVSFQPLNAALSFGILRFVPGGELASEPLGPDVILLTDDVPNDPPLVGGIITEALQTPLAHVNVLSRGRGTPNMALRDARQDPRIAPFLDQLVRFEVTEGAFAIRSATVAEAESFWEEQRPSGPRIAPRLDPSVTDLVVLDTAGLADIPSIGAKAAQLGELSRIISRRSACMGPIATPAEAFAVPVSFYLAHFEASGARAYLAEQMAIPAFGVDTRVRAEALAEVRRRMLEFPVDPTSLTLIEAAVEMRYGEERVRFRSSSNVEDLPEFSGAGLYTSMGAEIGSQRRSVENALRVVWSSLWNHRAFEERERGHIDQSAVAMGVLVHQAFISELANGITISRNINDLTRGDIYYFNVQVGEASVANPAPSVRTDQFLYRWWRTPRTVFESRSSLTPFSILRDDEIEEAACMVRAVHDAFAALLDPEGENLFFAVDVEWKLVGPERRIVLKQARPYDVGNAEVPADCRDF